MAGIAFAKSNTKLSDWGRFLSQSYVQSKQDSSNTKDESDVYEEGITAVVTNDEIEQATNFYVLAGADATTAKSKAVDYMEEREALYQEAIANGYTVTDEEVQQHIDQLKETINTAENAEEVQQIIAQFPSEDAYWDYEFTVYQKDLSIQKYVADLETKYNNSSIDNTSSSSNWETYYKQFKNKLVEKQNYHKK